MINFKGGAALTGVLLAGIASAGLAQNSISIPIASPTTVYAEGTGGGAPFTLSGFSYDAPYTSHLDGLQPPSYAEYTITTTTPGLYNIDVVACQSQDPGTVLQFETRPAAGGTRYATVDTKDYGTFGQIDDGSHPVRTYIDLGPVVDANNAVITVPLWSGTNIVRVRNVSGRHQPANSYPPDLSDKNDRPQGQFWSNVQIPSITLNRVGNLPTFGTVTGKVTGDKPAGIAVRGAWVTANPAGKSPQEPSDFWHWGYYVQTANDGTYTLQAPVGAQEIKAGRPSSYQVQGSTPIAVTVGATSVTANPAVTSIFHTDPNGDTVAYLQSEYLDSKVGNQGLVPVDGENAYKLGWIDAGDAYSLIVDVPVAGNYEVVASYDNGGNNGQFRVSTDLGQSCTGTHPNSGSFGNVVLSPPYSPSIYLPAGTNVITQTCIAPDTDYDALHLRLLTTPVTVGTVSGTVTDSVSGTPVAGAVVNIGTSTVTTDASGNYRVVVTAGTSLPVSVTDTYQDAPVSGTLTVGVNANITSNNYTIGIRPNIDLSSAAGNVWKLNPNTGGTADFSAIAAPETAFQTITVPSNWDSANASDDIYGWYRLHITVPANFATLLPNRLIEFHVVRNAIDDVDATYLNGVLIGSTGSFPATPLAPQPAGHVNHDANSAQEIFPGLKSAYTADRNYYFPASLLKPGQDNVIAVKVFDDQGGGGIVGLPTLEVAPATGTVTGTVKAAGTGVQGVRVGAVDSTGVTYDWALTDASGAYTLGHVPTGSMVIGAAKPGYIPMAQAVTVASNGTSTISLTTTVVPGGAPAATYDDFSDGPTGWQSKWDGISEETPGVAPTITEPGYDANVGPSAVIPSSITTEGSAGGNRGGILSKARFSKFASVNSARLISAVPSAPEPTGGVPNAIFQLKGNAVDDDPSMASFNTYIEYDLEGYATTGGDQRVRANFWGDGMGNMNQAAIPVPIARLSDVSPTNPLELTITRVGSYYDFYCNGVSVFDQNIKIANMIDHKIDLYSYRAFDDNTWDWVDASAATVSAAPLAQATTALRIAGGLQAATSGDMTNLNVVTTGTSAGKIDIADAVSLAKQGK